MYNIVFPCMMMSTLTVLVFCLPPDSGEKIALGVTVLLAFSVFMLAIAEKMPETSESIPLIGVYLTAVMAITCVSVIMTVIVLNFFYRGPTLTHVPAWAQIHILGKKSPRKPGPQFMKLQQLQNSTYRGSSRKATGPAAKPCARRGSGIVHPTGIKGGDHRNTACIEGTWASISNKWQIFRCSNARRKQVLQTENGIIPRSPNNGSAISEDMLNNPGDTTLHPTSVDIRVTPASPNGDSLSALDANLPYADDFHASAPLTELENGARCHWSARYTPNTSALKSVFTNNVEINMNSTGQSITGSGQTGRHGAMPHVLSTEQEYNRILAEINEKHAEEEEINAILQDWKLLAQKVDYILFWVFLCLTTVSSCIFIFILPYFKRGKLL